MQLAGRPRSNGSQLRPKIRNCRARRRVFFLRPRFRRSARREKEPVHEIPCNFPNISDDRRAGQIFIQFARVLEQLETFFRSPLFSTFAPLEISFFFPSLFQREEGSSRSRLKIFPFLHGIPIGVSSHNR